MAMYENICRHIHLPVQSGSSIMLEKMRRKYNREWYLERVRKIRSVIPDCGLTTDVIAGFCGETEQDHKDTLSLMEEVVFDSAFMFAYSERPGTLASKKYPDDIPYSLKTERLNEIIALQGRMSLKSNEKEIGKVLKVLVEGPSKKNPDELCGRASSNKMCVFPSRGEKAGDYCEVQVVSVTSATLLCNVPMRRRMEIRMYDCQQGTTIYVFQSFSSLQWDPGSKNHVFSRDPGGGPEEEC